MPDHIAEMLSADLRTIVIVSQRVEPSIGAARERVAEFYASGLLTAEGAQATGDGSLDGARAPAIVLSFRTGPKASGRAEWVALFAFDGLPIVEIVARFDEADGATREAIATFARGLHCS